MIQIKSLTKAKGEQKKLQHNVCNAVLTCRKAHGVTQQDLADAVDVTRQTIIAIEKGNYTPSVLLALKISRHFKKKLEDVFYLTKK